MNISQKEWFALTSPEAIDSPALLIYLDRVKENIRRVKAAIADPKMLRPHVKTHKSVEVTKLLIAAGIEKFKCSTIAEAEMLALAGAKDILLAYQPIGPKAERFVKLIQKYTVSFACLVDNLDTLKAYGILAQKEKVIISLYIDLNVGMNRTGIIPDEHALVLYEAAAQTEGVQVLGLHLYDGHIRHLDLEERRQACEAAFAPVRKLQEELIAKGSPNPVIVAGGSPTFPIYASKGVECSPGTFVYWDKGYHDSLPEQSYEFAALVLTRVISLPAPNIICVDLGYKAIASENELSKRVHFLNAPDLKVIGHSEEHLVLEGSENYHYKIGDVLYAVPYHICPTCALYEKAMVIQQGKKVDEWKVLARNRTIAI